jgi:hypothetical protein
MQRNKEHKGSECSGVSVVTANCLNALDVWTNVLDMVQTSRIVEPKHTTRVSHVLKERRAALREMCAFECIAKQRALAQYLRKGEWISKHK